jgi:hypothetical protein
MITIISPPPYSWSPTNEGNKKYLAELKEIVSLCLTNKQTHIMKKFLMVTITLIASVICFSQDNSSVIEKMFNNGQYTPYENVVEVTGKNKNEIYSAIKMWYGKTFKSAKNVIESDVAGEVIVGVGNETVDGVTYWFEITTMIKDNKFKTIVNHRKIVDSKYGVEMPPLEVFYSDWKNNKSGFFSKTGSMTNKEFVMVDLVYKTNCNITKGITKEVQNYNSF